MNPRHAQTESDSIDHGTRLAFQSMAIVTMAILLGDRAWRLLRDLNRMNRYSGRG